MKQENPVENITANPRAAAITGLLFAAPFLLMNAIVGEKIEPFISLLRPDTHTSQREYVFLFFVLSLLLVGAFIAVRPMLLKTHGVKRKLYPVNLTIAALLVAAFVIISLALGTEIYRCDVLQIPNCD